MVNNCCIPLCRSGSATPGVSLHKFTTDMDLKKIWIRHIEKYASAVGRTRPFKVTKYSKICSRHFLRVDFKISSERWVLKPTAIPTVYPIPLKYTNKFGHYQIPSNETKQVVYKSIEDVHTPITHLKMDALSSTNDTKEFIFSQSTTPLKLASASNSKATTLFLECSETSMEPMRLSFKNVYTCREYPDITPSLPLLGKHVRQDCYELPSFTCENSKIESYACSVCDFQTELTLIFQLHIQRCHNVERQNEGSSNEEITIHSYICEDCNFETYFSLKWLQHVTACVGNIENT